MAKKADAKGGNGDVFFDYEKELPKSTYVIHLHLKKLHDSSKN